MCFNSRRRKGPSSMGKDGKMYAYPNDREVLLGRYDYIGSMDTVGEPDDIYTDFTNNFYFEFFRRSDFYNKYDDSAPIDPGDYRQIGHRLPPYYGDGGFIPSLHQNKKRR